MKRPLAVVVVAGVAISTLLTLMVLYEMLGAAHPARATDEAAAADLPGETQMA